MKTSLKYTLLALSFLSLVSCDNLEGYYDEYNEKPTITIKKELGTEYLEEFKDSLKIGDNTYSFNFKITDEEENLDIKYSCSDDEVILTQNGDQITIESKVVGLKEIILTTEDAFKETDQCKLTLEVFENVLPTAKFEVKESDAMLSPLERVIDASGSFDTDAKFGGGLTRYQFRIDNQEIIDTPKKSINYIFPNQGSYQIWVRVRDNNDEWSEPFIERYTVK